MYGGEDVQDYISDLQIEKVLVLGWGIQNKSLGLSPRFKAGAI